VGSLAPKTVGSFAVLAALLAVSGSAQTVNPGKVNFFRMTNWTSDPYTTAPTAAYQQWFQANVTRMGVFSPYWDTRTSWYPNGLIYQDLYAIYNPSTVATQHPDWILHDQYGKPMYIPWGCSNGTCPQYAADIANPNFRNWWIAQMQSSLAGGNYQGMWVDDVNMDLTVGDTYGNLGTPIDDATEAPMTAAAWRNYIAQFVTQIRQAFPTRQIIHNAVWYSGPAGVLDQDPSIQAEIAAADVINIERGMTDTGLTGGTGPFSIYSLFAYIDRLHQVGRSALFENVDLTNTALAQYAIAGYFLISNGNDYHGDESSTPDNWFAAGITANLGTPLGPRTYSNGVYQRNFAQGIVLLGEPGLAPRTVSLPAAFTTLAGASVTSVTVSGSQGVILTGPFPNAAPPAVSLTTTTLPNGTVGVGYSAPVSATGGSGNYSFSLSNGPAGLGVNGTAIAGTPMAAGTFSTALVTVKDNNSGATAQKTLPITIYGGATITTNALPSGVVGASYSATLSASGGSGSYSWSIANQPAGLTLSGNTLSGTPSAAGTSSVTVTVTDSTTGTTAKQTLSLVIYSLPAVSTSSLANGNVGVSYAAALSATGGSGNYSWSASGLPAGLTINGSTISGTPTAAGTASVVVIVADATTKLTAQRTLNLSVTSAVSITTTSLASAVVGKAYSASLTAAGGSGNYTWAATGLPAGITLSGSTLAGTPKYTGTSSVVVTVKDQSTALTAQSTFSLVVAAAKTFTHYVSDLPTTYTFNSWGTMTKDKTIIGNTITLNGVKYAKGLGAHAYSELRYALNAGCSTLTATVGIDDEIPAPWGSLYFQVWGDGYLLYSGPVMQGGSKAININVNVSGRKTVSLIATNGIFQAAAWQVPDDHADWANAKVVCTW